MTWPMCGAPTGQECPTCAEAGRICYHDSLARGLAEVARGEASRRDDFTATEDDLRVAVRKAQAACGYSYVELKQQHRLGKFASLKARLAWNAIANLGDLA